VLAGTYALTETNTTNQGLVIGSAASTTGWRTVAFGSNSGDCGTAGCTITAVLKDTTTDSAKVAYYVGTHGYGLFRVTIPLNAKGKIVCSADHCGTPTQIPLVAGSGTATSPDQLSDISDLSINDGKLYVAAGLDGVYRGNIGNTSVNRIDDTTIATSKGTNTTGRDLGDSFFTAIEGAGSGTGRKVFVGIHNPVWENNALGVDLAQPVYTRENRPVFLAPEGRPLSSPTSNPSRFAIWMAAPSRM
jgi:hypothetical protein